MTLVIGGGVETSKLRALVKLIKQNRAGEINRSLALRITGIEPGDFNQYCRVASQILEQRYKVQPNLSRWLNRPNPYTRHADQFFNNPKHRIKLPGGHLPGEKPIYAVKHSLIKNKPALRSFLKSGNYVPFYDLQTKAIYWVHRGGAARLHIRIDAQGNNVGDSGTMAKVRQHAKALSVPPHVRVAEGYFSTRARRVVFRSGSSEQAMPYGEAVKNLNTKQHANLVKALLLSGFEPIRVRARGDAKPTTYWVRVKLGVNRGNRRLIAAFRSQVGLGSARVARGEE